LLDKLRRAHAQALRLALIDRIVADSRDVAHNHTAGLSLRSGSMTMFSLAELMDDRGLSKACIGICKNRSRRRSRDGTKSARTAFDYYYGLIDFQFFAHKNTARTPSSG
jgi:aspartate 4-decarboxylase